MVPMHALFSLKILRNLVLASPLTSLKAVVHPAEIVVFGELLKMCHFRPFFFFFAWKLGSGAGGGPKSDSLT